MATEGLFVYSNKELDWSPVISKCINKTWHVSNYLPSGSYYAHDHLY